MRIHRFNKIFQIKLIQNNVAFLKFVLVGGLNTAITYITYVLLIVCCVPWQAASPVSYAAGICNSYFLNKYWTFQNKTAVSISQVLKFLLVNLTSWGASFAALWILIDILDVAQMIAQIPAMIFSVLVNYVGTRYFVFLQKKDSSNNAGFLR